MSLDFQFLQPYLVERLSEIDGLDVMTADSVDDMTKVVVGDIPTAVVRCFGMKRLSEGNPDAIQIEQTWLVALIRRGAITEADTADGQLVGQIVEKLHGWTPDIYAVDPMTYDGTENEHGAKREHVSLFTTTLEINLR